jgi:signal transduction histidine kinase
MKFFACGQKLKWNARHFIFLCGIFFGIHLIAQNAAADTIRRQLAALNPNAPDYSDQKIGMLGTLFISIINTDPGEALKVNEELVKCEKEKGDSAGYYEALYRNTARVYEKLGDNTNNILNLEAYAEATNRIGKSNSYVYLDLGNAYYASDLRALAKGCYRQAEVLFKKEKNVQGLCTVYNNYAQIYMGQQQYDSALYELRLTHELRMNKLKDPALAGDSKLLIAVCFINLKQYDSAKIYLRDVINLIGSPELKANTDHVALQEEYASAYNRLASVFISQQNWDSAYYYLQKGFLFCRESGYTHRVNNMYATFAYFYLGRGMNDSALVNVHRFEKSVLEKNSPDASLRLYRLFADYYKAAGDSLSYYKYLSAYYLLDDSLKTQSVDEGSLLASGTIMQMKNKSRIEEQNARLEREEKEKFFLYAFSILLLFVFLTGMFFYFQIRKKNKLIQLYNIRLEEANLTKEKFLSVISHDLRTPFNTLIGMSNLLVQNIKNKKTESISANAEAINESSRKAFVLLDNLMQWVTLQKEKIVVNKKEVDVNELAGNLFLLFKNQALAQHVTLEKHASIARIVTDNNLLQVILRNLLSNAIRYIPSGGTVKLSFNKKEDDAIIIVEDNGPGIEPGKLKTLFEKKDHTSIARSGGGLGLLLVKEFAGQLNGFVEAENIPGGGARFIVTLKDAVVAESEFTSEEEKILPESRFSSIEKEKMELLRQQVSQYEIFDTTEIRECLEKFDTSGSPALETWIKNLSAALYHANDVQFKKLIALAA